MKQMLDPTRVEELFADVLAKPPDERAAWLEQACAGDAELRSQVEQLLAAHVDTDNALPLPVPPQPPVESAGVKIGRYQLLEQIGEGGFGVVFMAEQTSPVRRRVALKIIKLGMDTRQVVARFEAERQALAMMDHENIARVFDGGATDTGRPYFVMELVRGTPITRYCDEHHLSIAQRLELFIRVCNAVQHAHQKGIIHRDIKPTNVLVTVVDDKPVPKVIDFGIAKATAARLTERTLFTEFHQMIGTPEYMSPEQADVNAADIDTRSDVYSLGVLLYELLVGTTPFDAKELRIKAYGEIQRIIREVDPPRPSTRLSALDTLPSVAANRHTEPARLSKEVRGELDWIVMRCLEKDRGRRYESANALCRDIHRYIADDPVQACPPSRVYRFKKFVRRHKIAAAFVLLLIAAVGALAVSNVQTRRSERRANSETARAVAISDLLQQVLASSAVKDPAMAIELGHKLLAKDPKAARAWFAVGLALKEQGKLDEAIAHYRTAIELKPDESVYYDNLGFTLSMQNRLDESIEACRKAIELQPTNANAHNSLALALEKQSRFDEADAAYRKAIQLRPDYTAAIFKYSNMLVLQGKLAESAAQCQRLVQIEPRNAGAYINLAFVQDRQGKFDEAIAAYRKGIELDPKSSVAYGYLAGALLHKGNVDEAVATYTAMRKAIELDPKDAEGRHVLVWLLTNEDLPAEHRNPREAVELAKQAVHLAPRDRRFRLALGVAEYRAGNPKAAVEALHKAMELGEGSAFDYFHLSMAYQQLGDASQARIWYDKGAAWMDSSRSKDADSLGLRTEAAKLLGISQTQPATAPSPATQTAP